MGKILLIEDNDQFAQLVTETFSEYSFERARTYLEAVEKLNQGDYKFHLVDGFFPYGARVPEKITDEFISEGILNSMPFEEYIEIVMTGKDGTLLPMGALFARDLKRKGLDNYIICSAADHHSYTYGGLIKIVDKWKLNLNIIDEVGSEGKAKATMQYWDNIRNKLEQKLQS